MYFKKRFLEQRRHRARHTKHGFPGKLKKAAGTNVLPPKLSRSYQAGKSVLSIKDALCRFYFDLRGKGKYFCDYRFSKSAMANGFLKFSISFHCRGFSESILGRDL